jgi:peptidyl-dipeptidase A
MTRFRKAFAWAGAVLLAALPAAAQTAPAAAKAPTAEEAREFLATTEKELTRLLEDASRHSWIQATFITDDTQALAAQANERLINAGVEYAKKAATFTGVKLTPEEQRKLLLLRIGLTVATPSDPALSSELARLLSDLEAAYGKGKYCPAGGECLDLQDITKIMAESRDPQRLLEVWNGWHTVGAPMRQNYQRYAELANKGAQEIGFADTGALWRAKFDMTPDEFAKEVDRLWMQVKPLYESLHAYVRWKLREKYGDAVPAKGPIPAHLLGNVWAQDWSNVYDLVAPPASDSGYDLTGILKSRNMDAKEMVRTGERFFSSLGFEPMPETFWTRSLFTKPRDREVVCHPSAWDVDNVNDLRIKMCIDQNAEDFLTIHHELGHNYYQRAYNTQSILFRDSANEGFHEALGDTVALSVTPEYLVKIGLLEAAPPAGASDIGLLMRRALDKVAFLPFGLLIDQWRWKVFRGEITPAQFNKAWWDLKLKYQGVVPPSPRGEEFFDPGAKYHVPGSVPYTRYFLATILQFQFHRSLAKTAGCTSPIHRCSIYDSKAAGDRLAAMMAMGVSRPWPDALEALTGQRQMDATAIRDYFAPLQKWLDEQNKGKPVGW